MLDVHPPHQPVHSWREFFVHMSTIVLGLLIAIGLEQTVEALHRNQERHELIRDLHEECGNNIKLLAAEIPADIATHDWNQAAAQALYDAQPAGGYVTITLPSLRPSPLTNAPSRAVWSIAKSNGKVALLAENLAEVFDRVQREADEWYTASDGLNEAHRKASAIAIPLRLEVVPAATLHVRVGNVNDLIASFANTAVASTSAIAWSTAWSGACRAVLDGVQSRDAMTRYIFEARTTIQALKPQ